MRATRHALFFCAQRLGCQHSNATAATRSGSACPPPPAHLCPPSVSARLPMGTHLLHCPAVHIVEIGPQFCSAYSPVDSPGPFPCGAHFPERPPPFPVPPPCMTPLPITPTVSSLMTDAICPLDLSCASRTHQCPPARWLPGAAVMRGARGCTRPSLISMVKKVFMASRRDPAGRGARRCSAPPLPRAF